MLGSCLTLLIFVKKEELDAFHLCLDYKKAFDRPELDSIIGALAFFNFPERIRRWIRVLYKGFSVKIQNAGHFTDSIQIERSVHQGGCASAFLYIVLAETMAMQIRSNINIKGISTGQYCHKINQFADDTNATGHATQENVDNLLSELDRFHHHSGLVINYEKTVLYRISSQRNLPELYTQKQIAWETEEIQVLGIRIAENRLMERNYAPVLNKVKCVLKSWEQRQLSLFGKITVINTLAASLFVHKMQVLPTIDTQIVKKVETMFKEFIWNQKKSKISIDILKMEKQYGGAGLVCLKNS